MLAHGALAVAILKRRPRISLHAPSVLFAGSTFEVEVVLDAPKRIDVDFVQLELHGRIAGMSSRSRTAVIVGQRARLLEGATLPRGRWSGRARFSLPADAPPTHPGRVATVGYALDTHVSIPWWPDAREVFVLPVRAAPEHAVAGEPRVYVSSTTAAAARQPYLELSLASDVVRMGEPIDGAAALFNFPGGAPHELELELVATERWGIASSELARYGLRVPAPKEALSVEGAPIHFSLRVPRDASFASFTSHGLDVAWKLVARAHARAWRASPEVPAPIRVLPPAEAGAPSTRGTAPLVGNARIGALWGALANDVGLVLVDGELSGVMEGGVRVSIARDVRADGVRLVSRVTYPSLGLGLFVEEAGVLSAISWTERTFVSDAWSSRHRVRAREPAQVEALLAAVAAAAGRETNLTMTDTELTLVARDAGTTDRAVRALARRAVTIAHALPEARAAIPPPLCMSPELGDWRTLATLLSGRLELGDVSVVGRYAGHEAIVRTLWSSDGTRRGTSVSLASDVGIDESYVLGWERDQDEVGPDVARLPKAARTIVTGWRGSAEEIRINATYATVILSPAPPVIRHVTTTLTALAELLTALRAETGPYR